MEGLRTHFSHSNRMRLVNQHENLFRIAFRRDGRVAQMVACAHHVVGMLAPVEQAARAGAIRPAFSYRRTALGCTPINRATCPVPYSISTLPQGV